MVNVPGEVAEKVCRTGTNKPENISTGCRLGLVWCYKRYQGLEPQGIPGDRESRSEQRNIKKGTPRQVADCGWSGVKSGIRAWSLKVFLEVQVQVSRREREHLDNCGRMGLVWSYSTRSDRAWSLIGLVWSYSGDRAWSLKALLEMQNKKEK